jgi:hypothetical protein
MEDLKAGDRVTFLVIMPNNQATSGAGVVTRYGIHGQPMIMPNVPLPPGSRMANIQKAKNG